MQLDRFGAVLGRRAARDMYAAMAASRDMLADRVIWSVNSTEHGGGVAEMLRSLIGYARGTEIDARWMVVEGSPEFFLVTKRIHNRLHGSDGDGGPLGEAERAIYERTLVAAGRELASLVRPGDMVLLHDPQTTGLAPALAGSGAHVVWRSHIGTERPGETGREAARFLLPYLADVEACVFSREAYAWPELDPGRVAVIAPSIDPFSPKNEPLERSTVHAILHASGIVDGAVTGVPRFTREDGSRGRVDRRAEVHQDAVPSFRAPLVVQVSRWDRLKDHLGVLLGFAEHVAARSPAQLVLAGPAAGSVSDDPEGDEVLRELLDARASLAPGLRAKVHVACLPMDDVDENAAMVNALQRHARVVVQKSLAEGFGLTVAEAMWKGRPVIGSAVGGIGEQIVDGRTGFLLADPADLRDFGERLLTLLGDPLLARRMGRAGRRRVVREFLGPRHLTQYLLLFQRLSALEARPARSSPLPAS